VQEEFRYLRDGVDVSGLHSGECAKRKTTP
jgi:hypothetical protein